MVELRKIVLIHDLKRQGLSVSAIARQTGLDRKTVPKYLDRGLEVPVYGPRDPAHGCWSLTKGICPRRCRIARVYLVADCSGRSRRFETDPGQQA